MEKGVADSNGRRNIFVDSWCDGLGWCCGVVGQFEGLLVGFRVVRGLAGPVVGFHGGCVGVLLGVSGRVGPLGGYWRGKPLVFSLVLGALPGVRAMDRTPLPARRMSAMAMRSSMPPRHRSTSGRPLRPVERVLPLRQAFPVRLDTPTAWAARVKSMPPRTGSGGFARLAARMSRSLSYLVPSNSNTMFRSLPNPRCRDVH